MRLSPSCLTTTVMRLTKTSESLPAIITIPIALFGFIFIPALPWEAKPNWILSAREIEIARNRMQRVGRKGAAPWTKARVRKLFSSWHLYVLRASFPFFSCSFDRQISMLTLISVSRSSALLRSYTSHRAGQAFFGGAND